MRSDWTIGKAEVKASYLLRGRFDVFKRALKQLLRMIIEEGNKTDPEKDYIRIEYIKRGE
jgi:hypothetical protein